jgi:hypothetical protein
MSMLGDRRARTVVGLGWVAASRLLLALPGASLQRRLRWIDGLAARLPELACGAEEAARAVTTAARRVPGVRCLSWTLALRGMVTQAGLPSEVRIGVAPAGAGAIKAHAWLECQGHVWSWPDEVAGYAALWPPVAS